MPLHKEQVEHLLLNRRCPSLSEVEPCNRSARVAWFTGCDGRWNWRAFSALMTGLFLVPCLYLTAVEGGSIINLPDRDAEDRSRWLSQNPAPGLEIEGLINADGGTLSVEDLWIDGERLVFVLSAVFDPLAHSADTGVSTALREASADE